MVKMTVKNPIKMLGKKILDVSRYIGESMVLFMSAVGYIFHAPFELKNIIKQVVEIGIRSLSVITLSALFTGMVFAFHIGYVSNLWLGSPIFVGLGTTIAILKELGPVITGLILSGRVGAQITAELGTMKVTEQIDALYTLGTNPVKYLYVPRFLAAMVAVPILTLYTDVIATFGGFIVAVRTYKIPPNVFWCEIVDYIHVNDVNHGIIKAFFFGLIIVIVSCYKGLSCKGGAEGVGKSTTSAVVVSMILILIADYFLTSLLTTLGIGVE